MKIAKKVFILFAVAVLTGCSGNISVKPSTDSLGAMMDTATGSVHLYPAVKGKGVIPSKKDPSATDLTAFQESVWTTKDDVVAAVHESALDALRKAGYTVSSGSEAPGNAEIEVGITVQEVVGSYKRNGLTLLQGQKIIVGDFGKKEDNIFSKSFNNNPTGVVITEVTFKNKKTGAETKRLVAGADTSWGMGSNAKSVQDAVENAMN